MKTEHATLAFCEHTKNHNDPQQEDAESTVREEGGGVHIHMHIHTPVALRAFRDQNSVTAGSGASSSPCQVTCIHPTAGSCQWLE